MEYPKDPTVLPSAQRHTETYHADQGRVFTDGDVISIQIPPTTNSYLTKDAQLHFDFDMTYQEGTDKNYQEIAGNLSFDNQEVVLGTGYDTLSFQVGTTPGTLTVPESTYTGYDDICKAFNNTNSNHPLHLYYDDLGGNQVLMLYGILTTPLINDQIVYTLDKDLKQGIVNFGANVYVPGGNFYGYDIPDITETFNSQVDSIRFRMVYNPTTHKFYFLSKVPFSILSTPETTACMISLGFDSQPGGTQVLPQSGTFQDGVYYLLAENTCPLFDEPTITLEDTDLAQLLGFTTTPLAFDLDPETGVQTLQGEVRTPTVPKAGCTPNDFFKNIIYTEATSTSTANPKTFPNVYRPYPTLDVNGPYGFFESLEVYDYLGNTLLEKVPRHDLLTAIWSDLESSTETQDTIIRPRYIDDDLLTITKPSCSFLVSGNPNTLYAQSPITNDLTSTDPVTEENVKAATLSIPTLSCGINLYSFLGKLSEKFVPLHNGFTVKFFINRRENVIAFNTEQPNNRISYVATPDTGSTWSNSTDMKPFVKTYTFSNVYLRGDIVTVPPELDSRIDKIVFSKGYKVQRGVPQNRAQRVNTEVKSLTSLIVVQQPTSTHNGSMRYSAFIRNYCKGAKLLFNKAVVSSVKNFTEAYRNFRNVFGCTWDEYVRRSNWEVDFPSSDAAWMQTRLTDKASLSNLDFSDPFFQDVSVPLGRLPRYLLSFDTRLPGYTPMAVCGIDTRKQLLEIQLETTTDTKQSADVTMISEFDTFIEIKPSESSAVSF